MPIFQGGGAFQGLGAYQQDLYVDTRVPAVVPRIYIAGIDVTTSVRDIQNLDLAYTLGSRGVLSFETLDMSPATATAYRPALDQVVTVVFDGTTIFYGTILHVDDRALGEPNVGVVTSVSAIDYSSVTDDRLIDTDYPATGQPPPDCWTLHTVVEHIVADKLAVFGIVLDPGMGTGPSVVTDIAFDNVTVTAALNYLSAWSGWVWRITPDRILEMFPLGAMTAPYSLTSTNQLIRGGVEWSKTRQAYVNTVTVRFGGSQRITVDERFIVTGPTATYFLRYPAVLNDNGHMISRGVVEVTVAGSVTNETLGIAGVDGDAGASWLWDAGTNSVTRFANPTIGATIVVTHAVQFPLDVVRQDGGEVLIHGPRERRLDAPDVTDIDQATTIAESMLRRQRAIARQVSLRTWEGMVYPGDTIVLTIPERTLSGTWLVTEVQVRSVASSVLEYELTCIEGDEAQATWVDYFRTTRGGGSVSGSSGSVLGDLIPAQSSIFNDGVIAYSGQTGKEVRIGQLVGGGSQGPGIQLGRGKDLDVATWTLTGAATGFYGTHTTRFSLTADRDHTLYPYALQARRITDGQYCLLPAVSGGSTGTFLGDPLGLTGESSALRTWAGVLADSVYATNTDSVSGYTERGRSTKLGERIPTTFDATAYTGDIGTWVVASADQLEIGHSAAGELLTVVFEINDATITGAPNYLKLRIPGGYTAAARAWAPLGYARSAGNQVNAAAAVFPGETFIRIYRLNAIGTAAGATAWSNGTNDTDTRGAMTFWLIP